MKWSFLAEKVNQIIIRNMLADTGDRIMLAVSGGLDSVVLLHVILELQSRWKWDITIGHLNHGLRPGYDNRESVFCRELAAKYHLKYVEKELELLDPEKTRKYTVGMKQNPSPESLARSARYEVFEKWAEDLNCKVVFTAHHANDQAETILYRMFTGSGLSGLSGIPMKRDLYRRPFKTIMRAELEEYACENALKYCEDLSNRNEDHVRNRIRHKVIPLLRNLGFEQIEQSLARSAESIREAEEALSDILEDLAGKHIFQDAEAVRMRTKAFTRLPLYFQKDMLKHVHYDILGNTEHITNKQLDQICDFICRGEAGRCMKMAGRSLVLEREEVLWPLKQTHPKQHAVVCADGEYQVYGGLLIIKTVKRPADLSVYKRDSAFFSSGLKGRTLIWRKWEDGDRMLLFGLGKQKKISDVLKDEKIPPTGKKYQAVLLCEKEIIWVPGVKNSNIYTVDEKDEYVIEIQFITENNDD